MKKSKIFGISVLALLTLSLLMSFASAEGDGSVTISVTSDSPITVIANGKIVPQIIHEHYNPIRLKRMINELAEQLGETDFALMVTMSTLNTTTQALNETIKAVNTLDSVMYDAHLRIGKLEVAFNDNNFEIKNFEEYTDEQLNILFDGIADLKSEIRMELDALTLRVDNLEERVSDLETVQTEQALVLSNRDLFYTTAIFALFVLFAGVAIGIVKTRPK